MDDQAHNSQESRRNETVRSDSGMPQANDGRRSRDGGKKHRSVENVRNVNKSIFNLYHQSSSCLLVTMLSI